MADPRRGNRDQRLLHDLLAGGTVAGRSDVELIELFLTGHGEAAEAAFGTLVERHGPMVLALARRIVRDDHTAEDVFQAVFLILARQAKTVRIDDSLGRWLYGVTRRVALRARSRAGREIPAPAATDHQPGDPAAEVVRDEIRVLVDHAVADLPRRYREAVRLFHLDGLGQDQVAEALGVPVGTVRSRLARGRSLLRSRLSRRGVTSPTLATWLGTAPPLVRVPANLARATLANLASGGVGASSPRVLVLVHTTMRMILMTKLIGFSALSVTLGCLAGGVAVLANGDGPAAPVAQVSVPAPTPVPVPAPVRAEESLETQFRRIAAEFQAAREHAWAAAKGAKSKPEEYQILADLAPNIEGYSRRIVNLAAAHPEGTDARDALIWIIHQPQQSDGGDYGDDFAHAARLLVYHHADDPEVARAGLGLESNPTQRRETFLEGIYGNARNREAQGLIRLARADYLIKQARFIISARKFPAREIVTYRDYDEQGKLVEKTVTGSNENEGYRVHLRMLDPDFVRREGERLYEEIVARYADVPYVTLGHREMEREVRAHPSTSITDPAQKQVMILMEQDLAAKRWTLGQMATRRLDELRNLAVGKLAPEFAGIGVDGKLIRLVSLRGQVVVLSCWDSSCEPYLKAIPQQKDLVAKLKGRPFTLLGVVTDGNGEAARKIIDAEGITWPNILSGGENVASLYHVQSNPDCFVLDAGGVIRSKGQISSSSLAKLVEKLVSETEARRSKSGAED